MYSVTPLGERVLRAWMGVIREEHAHLGEVIRRYQRINGIRVPVAIESVAQVLLAGRSTFKMTYEYETINGSRVGDPRPR